MALKNGVAAVLALAFLPLMACSKTQDTAPEQRIFGAPPSIQGVNFSTTEVNDLQCDYTEFMRFQICQFADSINPGHGFGFTLVPSFVILKPTYTQMNIQVGAVDSDSTASKNDILLVAASYILSKTENSIVLFDDGNKNQFPFAQQGTDGLICPGTNPQPPGPCGCSQAQYSVSSGDATAGDNLYTRNFAFVNQVGTKGTTIMQNCIAGSRAIAPPVVTAGEVLNFRIDVVDRAGNLTTWPQKPSLTVGHTSLKCDGDPCACCLLTKDDVPNDCRQLQGVQGEAGSGFEAGLCVTFFP